MTPRRVLFIGPGWEQADLAAALKKAGHSVVEHAYDPFQINALLKFAEESKVDAVVSDQCDYSRYAEETVAQALGLSPLPTATVVGVSKLLQRQLAQGHAPQPRFQACHSLEAARKAWDQLGGDVVLKPSDARGGFGVSRVRSAADVEKAYYRARRHAVFGPVLMETFIPGELVTFDGLIRNGEFQLKAVSKSLHELSYSVCLQRHVYGQPEDEKELTRLSDPLMRGLCRALGFTQGFIHSEWIYKDGRLTFVEIANRAPGIRAASRMMAALCGEDLYAQVYPDLLSPAANPRKRYCVQQFFFGLPREAAALEGRLKQRPEMLDAEIWPRTDLSGDEIVRLGHVTLGGDRLEDLLTLASEITSPH